MGIAKHDHQCLKCNERTVTDKIDALCPWCGAQMALMSSAGVTNFKEFWHPNLAHQPVKISSAKGLDAELHKRGMFINETRGSDKVKLPRTEKEALNV